MEGLFVPLDSNVKVTPQKFHKLCVASKVCPVVPVFPEIFLVCFFYTIINFSSFPCLSKFTTYVAEMFVIINTRFAWRSQIFFASTLYKTNECIS